jgi:uncharacterized membrane protein
MANKKAIALALLALAAVAAALVFLLLRGGGEAPAPQAEPADEPFSRIADPEYRKQLEVQRNEYKEILRRIDATQREIAELGDDTNSERYVMLTNRLYQQAAEVDANRKKSQAIVRNRINRENETLKKQEFMKQKGK